MATKLRKIHPTRNMKKMAKFYNKSVKASPLKTIGLAIGIGTLSNIIWHQLRK